MPRRSPARKRRTKSDAASRDPEKREFLPEVLDRTVIAIPLLNQMKDRKLKGKPFHVIIDVNLDYGGGRAAAAARVREMIATVMGRPKPKKDEDPEGTRSQYVFDTLPAEAIRTLARMDAGDGSGPKTKRAIYHIWPDFPLKRLANKSIRTVKADAAHNAFAALGEDIVWAVVDSGIDGTHKHFSGGTLDLPAPLKHRDFTSSDDKKALVDEYGHGTHVAGIIAGAVTEPPIAASVRHRNEQGQPVDVDDKSITRISGMAPRAKLLSLKVLDREGRGNGTGRASAIIAALQYIQELNGHGRRLLVHGVNLSVGYDFEPEWFACGQSPLCIEVDRLVKAGVVVVVAAGNSGYSFRIDNTTQGSTAAGLDLTINDPGNADLAITVGSTHRDMPHIYGVSYFSSKGPTGDGRMKPDLLAPGEKIVSCDSTQRVETNGRRRRVRPGVAEYREESGTSMAAPHVSGVIAAFLSIRPEFRGRPEEVKRIFMSTATDLHRAPYFQGRGLVDLMRAIQSV